VEDFMMATCIGCGCTDAAACWDPQTEQPCHWTRLDRASGLGVCSCCQDHIARWDAGDRAIRAKYRPSNGTEGQAFIAAWCGTCARDRSLREGEPVETCDDNELCDIVGRTMMNDVDHPDYPAEWTYDASGRPICTAYISKGQPVPTPRCTHTSDLF
jgi:hypothetical protein